MIFAALMMLAASADLESARDRQDRAALEKIAAARSAAAANADGHYEAAVAASYFAEVALELRDRGQAQRAAQSGIRHAEQAIALNKDVADYHRVLGTLCGQVIPANVLAGFKYGKRAQDAIARAIALDPKSSQAYLARGVGSYYLPAALGGGADPAIRDFEKAVALDPKSAEAYLWLGLGLRKAGRNDAAREAFQESLKRNPNRLWTKLQLEKTSAQ